MKQKLFALFYFFVHLGLFYKVRKLPKDTTKTVASVVSTMKQTFIQLYLLLWKCWKCESRNKVRLIAQIVWPLLLFLILVAVRLTRNLRDPHIECMLF